MASPAGRLDETFAALRRILARHEKTLLVQIDEPDGYQLASRSMNDRVGRPLFVAALQKRKSYVSFHFMPVYTCPELVRDLSPALKKRMQGKSCFNFKSIDDDAIEELTQLTKKGLARFKNIALPWADQGKAKPRS